MKNIFPWLKIKYSKYFIKIIKYGEIYLIIIMIILLFMYKRTFIYSIENLWNHIHLLPYSYLSTRSQFCLYMHIFAIEKLRESIMFLMLSSIIRSHKIKNEEWNVRQGVDKYKTNISFPRWYDNHNRKGSQAYFMYEDIHVFRKHILIICFL